MKLMVQLRNKNLVKINFRAVVRAAKLINLPIWSFGVNISGKLAPSRLSSTNNRWDVNVQRWHQDMKVTTFLKKLETNWVIMKNVQLDSSTSLALVGASEATIFEGTKLYKMLE